MIFFLLFAGMLPLGIQSVQAGNPFAGQQIYARYCQTCHGPKGRGHLAGTPDFSWRGMPNNGLGTLDQTLATRILNGKNTCPSFRGILDEGAVMNVITHLRTLR
ncbi:MAG: cytochrome c [Magnetococcus sp. YQC-5]